MPRALIVVDVQVDFCEGGSLAVTGGAQVASDISKFILKHENNYDVIVATADWHKEPGTHFSENPDFVDTWPAHCVINTPGAAFHPNLHLPTGTPIFRKGEWEAAYSGFEGVYISDVGGGYRQAYRLDKYLAALQIDSADIVGIATDYCVKATAIDAAKAGFSTRVILDLTAAVAEETRNTAIAEMSKYDVRMAHVWEFEPCHHCNNQGLNFD